jgi:hypothetical protein
MSNDFGRRAIRKRSEAVCDRRKQRKRRSATLPDSNFSFLPMSAMKNNPEDFISRMETPVLLPHLRQPATSYR